MGGNGTFTVMLEPRATSNRHSELDASSWVMGGASNEVEVVVGAYTWLDLFVRRNEVVTCEVMPSPGSPRPGSAMMNRD